MRVAIVGAGFSGIGMGAALQRAGHEYAIFERADDLGGVWQHNTYPGRLLRRAVVRLLVLVGAAARLVTTVLAAGRDPGVPAGGRRPSSGVIGKIRFGAEVTEARWDPTRCAGG